MNAIGLRHGHFPVLEARAFQLHFQIADHEGFVQRFLLGKSAGIDGFETGQIQLGPLQVVVDGFLGEIVQLVVPSLVAQDGGVNRAGTQGIFPALSQQIVERLATRIDVRLRQGEGKGRHRHQQSRHDERAHRFRRPLAKLKMLAK